MPTTQQLRTRLANKLKELFQLDQPDLDFGFYRIMHAKAEQVTAFIENDLLTIVEDAFGHLEVQNSQGLLTQAKQRVIDTLGEDAFDAEGNLVAAYRNSPIGKNYLAELAKIEQSKSALSAEADIYDHLYRFFERYYDAGDFISRRYYARETAGKAAPFAIPYNGEEVKLHWANADQYYIKTTEYFTNFTFDLRQAAEVRAQRLPLDFSEDESPLRVHFRVVEATEGEHGNVKASEANKRFFIIHSDNPITRTETGELVVNFEYRADPAKAGQDNTWRDKRNAEAVELILNMLGKMAKGDAAIAEYLRLLQTPAPTEKEKNRPLLAKYINQYTARNTMDYFIHKDLGGFLRRELDFYIKNEVMRLDDIENAEAPAVETYLAKIKVLRKIAGKLIAFLTQLEEFQKKLWLKKKFIVETNYCITLDRVPEELYAEIAANEAQREEWVRLFAIDEIQVSTIGPGYSVPLSVDFLKANDKLVLDTQFFDELFKARLLAAIENFDEQCDGLLVHSENFQALSLLQERYLEQVKCIYIDPPYNTGGDDFTYKDSYQHSSWLSLLLDRLMLCRVLMNKESAFFSNIDDAEFANLKMIGDAIFGENCFIANAIWRSKDNSNNDSKRFSSDHNYTLVYSKSSTWQPAKLHDDSKRSHFKNPDNDPRGPYFDGNPLNSPNYRANLIYDLISPQGITISPPKNGWRWSKEEMQRKIATGEIRFTEDGKAIRRRTYLRDMDGLPPSSLWIDLDKTGHNRQAKYELLKVVPEDIFDTPKPVKLVDFILKLAKVDRNELALDYFAGSGTTGHAVINLNREDAGTRRYILIEIGDYFDTVLKPRIVKATYSQDWKDGKPITQETGISHCVKYLRLESYEDTLNNLRFDENATRHQTIAANAALKEDYMLNYLLDVETRGSQSLLNIDAFVDPTAYTLQVKKPGTDEHVEKNVDLLETFNYLIGLRVNHIAAPQSFSADFERLRDPELPDDQHTKLVVSGRIRQDAAGPWWFRKVEGWVPRDPANPNNGQQEKVLIVWRKLTGDLEKDNLMLDEWFQRNRINTRDFEFDTIYVNGSNNLPNLKLDEENWKVRLTEEEFMKRMWAGEGA